MDLSTSRRVVTEKKKPSWLPITVALVIPVIAVIVILVVNQYRPVEPVPAASTGSAEQAYLTVRLENEQGEVLGGKRVDFIHNRLTGVADPPKTALKTYERETDSAGLVTLNVPREGDVTILVEGQEATQKIKNMERNASQFFELTLIVDEEEQGTP